MDNNEQDIKKLLNIESPPEIDNQAKKLASLDLIEDSSDLKADETITLSKPGKTKVKFAESVTNRLILICCGTGGILLAVGLIYQTFFALGQEVAKAIDEEKTSPNPVVETKAESQAKPQEDNYRGQIALYQQQDDIEAIEKAQEVEIPKIVVEETETSSESSLPVPQPIAQPPRPLENPVVTRPLTRPIQNTIERISKPQSTKVEYDNIGDWNDLANLGSYGYTAINSSAPSSSKIKTIAPISNAPPVTRRNLSTESSVLISNPGNLPVPYLEANYSSAQELRHTEIKAINYLNQPDQFQSFKVKQNRKFAKKAKIGQQIQASLNNPMQAVKGSSETQVMFLTLDEPILDTQKQVLIPKDTQLVYQWQITSNGIVKAKLQSFILNDEEISIPENTITLKDKKGGVLIAKYKERKNTNGNRDVIDFALGVSESATDLVNRPSSSSSFIGNNGSGSSTTYDDPNYPLAIATEGASRVLKNRSDDLNQAYNSTPVLGIWEIKDNTKLTLQVNRSFSL